MRVRKEYVKKILGPLHGQAARNDSAEAFMPSNIALIKYWGKRDAELNLPLVSSLSYTLDGYGTTTRISLSDKNILILNGEEAEQGGDDYLKVHAFADLFRAPGEKYRIETENNIPTAAGVASSASGFAALLAALLRLKVWDVPLKEQSMLARLGSGSAARSFWPGLVLWHKGARDDGMDCYAEPCRMPLSIGMAVLLLEKGPKAVSSREAMGLSLSTSPHAVNWPKAQQEHLDALMAAGRGSDFEKAGRIAENNAVLLHTLLEESQPPIVYDTPATRAWKQKVHDWRAAGLPVYFTQDAGPNLKIIFPLEYKAKIEGHLGAAGIDYFTV